MVELRQCKNCQAPIPPEKNLRFKYCSTECRQLGERAGKKRKSLERSPEKRAEDSRRWRQKNPEKSRENSRKWREKNREKLRALVVAWNKKNPKRMVEVNARWHRANRDKRKVYYRNRANSIKRATPSWLTKDQREEMVDFKKWAHAKTIYTGVKHEVDHIIPLQGKVVCGLHVPWNLQILTQHENHVKAYSCSSDG